MKKIFLFAATLLAAVAINAQEPVVSAVSAFCNYLDIHAEYPNIPAAQQITDKNGTAATSETPIVLSSGSKLVGYFNNTNSIEAINYFNVKSDYNTNIPVPKIDGIDSLTVGTMWRANSGCSIELGAITVGEGAKLQVYYQPNGDSDRGVKITVQGGEPVEFKESGVKINDIRPAYVAELDLEKGQYEAGEIVITVVVNTINIFGVHVEEGTTPVENLRSEAAKAQKIIENGQVYILRNGEKFNLLGARVAE